MNSLVHFRRVPAVFLLVGLMCVGLSCGGGGGGSGGGEDRSLRILVTDAPFPYDDVVSAIVEVQRIEIRMVGGAFETLIEFPSGRKLDLVQLRNGATDLLFEGSPAAGDYDAVRIVVVAREITIVDGAGTRSFTEFKVPSGEQTGVKVNVDPVITVAGGLSQDLLLDMDLSRSFVVQGNPGTPAGIKGFHFKPVVKAVNSSTAGSLTFRVKSDNGTPANTTDDFFVNGAAYTLTEPLSGAIVASGASGPDPSDLTVQGFALYPAIPAGLYDLEVGLKDHDSDLRTVSIQVANLTDLGEIVLGATGGVIEGTATTTLTTTGGKVLEFPVPGALVEAGPAGSAQVDGSDTTNSLGSYAISPLGAGTYDVRVTLAGYESAVTQADSRVFGTPETPADFVLVPKADDVNGSVVDGNGKLLAGATVRATVTTGAGSETILETTADASGQYTLAGLPTWSYRIEWSHASGVSGSQALDHLGGAGSVTLQLTLQ